jgi:ribosome recycling factor
MIEETKSDAKTRMSKSVEALKHSLGKVRTGRAHPSLLDHLSVPYYGSEVPLSQVSNVAVEDSRTLTVPVIEKAIISSDLGLNPMTAGMVIRIPLPPLTEERRRDLIRVVRQDAENARVAIRNIRRDANQELKLLLKEKEISEDEDRKAQEAIQALTDQYIAEVDKVLEAKEAELLEV